MNNIKKAFTLIELLVVTTIIALISGSGVFYFLDFVQQQKINQKLIIIDDDLKELDKQVKNYKIFDYQLEFNKTNTGYYITYINNFDSENQTLEITDINTGSGKITTTATITGTGIIKIYKNHKLFLNKEIDRTTTFKFNFKETPSYKIIGTNSGEILNQIELKYFSEENLYPENNDLLELIDINTREDGNGASYSSGTITNIGGKKEILGNLDLPEIYLIFDNNGKESFIKITK